MIYLDNAATTRPCPEAVEAMGKALAETWGNPSATHAPGRAAEPSLAEVRLLRANAIKTFDTISLRLRAAGADLFFHASHTIDEGVGPIFEYVFEKGIVR